MNQRIRKLAVIAGAAFGLLATSSTAQAAGTITGFVFDCDQNTKAVAIAADGTRHEVKVRRNCHYRIENLPAGTYELEFSRGKTLWIAEDDAVVDESKDAVVNTNNPAAR